MTDEERDAQVVKFLNTPNGRWQFRRALFHGHATLGEALRKFYVPSLLTRRRMQRLGLRVIDGGRGKT